MHNHSMSAAANSMPSVNWGRKFTQTMPTVLNLLRWHDAILLRKQLDAGTMTVSDFNQAIGNKMDSTTVPNIQMVIFDCNYLNNQFDVNKRIQALKTVAYVWGFQWYSDQPTGKYFDIMLPAPVWFFEDPLGASSVRFKSGGTFNNHFIYLAPAIPPDKLPGEVRPVEWVLIQLADKLGFASNFNPTLYPQVKGAWNPATWESAVVAAHKTAYETWAALPAITPLKPPSWTDFLNYPVFYLDAPYTPPYDPSLVGTTPFKATAANMKATDKNRDLQRLPRRPCQGRKHSLQLNNMPWKGWRCGHGTPDVELWYVRDISRSAHSELSSRTPHTRERLRSTQAHFNDPLLKDDCYRHAVWLSAADAASRGINDGDQVRVFNNVGEAVLEAYVTNRLLPGVAAIGHGGWYAPSRQRQP